jgi:hypothetical protein
MLSELGGTAFKDIHELISQTADVYEEAAGLAVSSSAAAYHARFLRALVAKDAESKIGRVVRPSVSTSRASPVDEDDVHHPPPSAVSTYASVHPGHAPRHERHSMHSAHSSSPQYPGFQSVPHAALPPAIQSTPQMSPTETKPVITAYRTPSIPSAPLSAGGPAPTYPHYNSGVEFAPHPHGAHPPMVVQYPPVMQGTQSIPSDLDMRYSHNLLSELGYPLMGIEPVAEWFTQAMGPSGCAGML